MSKYLKLWHSALVLSCVLSLSLWSSQNGCAQVAAPNQPMPPSLAAQGDNPALKKAAQGKMFSNPLIKNGPAAADPYMTLHNGWYYLCFTTGWSVEIWASRNMVDWSAAKKKIVWKKPETGAMSRDVWAPEVHFLDGKWYAYFTASDDGEGNDPRRRIYVAESASDDIFSDYTLRGQIKATDADEYAIDGSIFNYGGKHYFIWSGRENSATGPQRIYIAPMSNPWTISGPRVELSKPDFDWEKHGWEVNEGPTILSHSGRNWLIYSASGAATPFYELGQLELIGANPLDPKSWKKSPEPVFKMNDDPQGGAYTVGHGSFVSSPDGSEIWNIYHGKDIREDNWSNRTMRADPVRWRLNGEPYFGTPTPRDVLIPVPSGTQPLPMTPMTMPLVNSQTTKSLVPAQH